MAVAKGQLMQASDVLGLSFFPVGSVIAIGGTSTVASTSTGCRVNGQDLPGWYICNGNNPAPDLKNKFIVGTGETCGEDPEGKASVTLTEKHLPRHTHTVTVTEVGFGGKHVHQVPIDKPDDYNYSGDIVNGNDGSHASGVFYPSKATRISGTGEGGQFNFEDRLVETSRSSNVGSQTHSHDISISLNDTGRSSSVDLAPQYYNLVFIKKCA